MNKKANWFFKGLFLIIICTIWFTAGIGSMLGNMTMSYIRAHNMTGISAFLLGNINLLFIILLILFLAGWTITDRENTQ